MEVKRFKHTANAGDCVASLAAVKSWYERFGTKVIWCQQLNVIAQYYAGAVHPVMNGDNMVMMNQKMWDMITPLLLSQDYIDSVEVFEGQKIDANFDDIRQKTFVNIPFGAIQQWPMLAFPDLARDLTKTWIDVPDIDMGVSNKIILNFTERYRSHLINYFFLKDFQDKVIFAGTPLEHKKFCEQWNLKIPLLEVENFLQLAQAIKSCRFLMSNQSMCWNIAEAMKTPRLLEMSSIAPNCQPFIGADSYGFFYQEGLEYYFGLLNHIK